MGRESCGFGPGEVGLARVFFYCACESDRRHATIIVVVVIACTHEDEVVEERWRGGGYSGVRHPPPGECAEMKRSSQSDVPLVFILRRDFFPTTVQSVEFFDFFCRESARGRVRRGWRSEGGRVERKTVPEEEWPLGEYRPPQCERGMWERGEGIASTRMNRRPVCGVTL